MSEGNTVKLIKILKDADDLTKILNEKCQWWSTSAVICAVIQLSEKLRERHPDLYTEGEKLWHEFKGTVQE